MSTVELPSINPALHCLLCHAANSRVVWQISGRELRELFKVGSRTLSDAAFGRITPDFMISLHQCQPCGFEFFDPALAGSGEFYEELEQTVYYPETRPEFGFALDFCAERKVRRLIDVGCGDGAFLDRVRAHGVNTLGLELNEHAAAAAAAKGHLVLSKDLAQVTPEELGGHVEFLTLFQVIEHVPDPCGFLRLAAGLVAPGGYLMISVPNRFGSCRLIPYDPANLPPHHVSRWREKDLVALSVACGLRTVENGADPLYGGDLLKFALLHNRLASAIGRRPRVGGEWLPKLLSFAYRKLGLRHFLPFRGPSIYAVLQRS